MKCSEGRHILIRHRLLGGIVIGVNRDDVERIELVNCPDCFTTLGRHCEDARHLDILGRPLCGVPSEGTFLVDDQRHVDCPLCRTSIEIVTKRR